MRLDMGFAMWEEKKADFISEIKALLNSSQVIVTAREGRRASLVLEVLAAVENPVAAVTQVEALQTQAATGTLVMAGSTVSSISDPVQTVSTGCPINSISPNIVESGIETIITITGSAALPYDAATRILVNGVSSNPTLITSTTLRLDLTPQLLLGGGLQASANTTSAISSQVTLMAEYGSSTATVFQYNPLLLRVTKCFPVLGKIVGGQGGGGPVTVIVSSLSEMLALPDMDHTQIRCRFGPLYVVEADIDRLLNGTILCLPPASSLAGPVTVSMLQVC